MAGKYCMNCGATLPEDAKFCYKCGANQNNQETEIGKRTNDEKKPFVITLDQFENNLKRELKLLGESTKKQSNFLGLGAKDIVEFSSPSRSSFSCKLNGDVVKEIDLTFTDSSIKNLTTENRLKTIRNFYYACGLAIERDNAEKNFDYFYSLQSIHLDHFHCTVNAFRNPPYIKFQMWVA